MLMLHHRFANASQVSVCKSNWQKLEKMKSEPNNTQIPYIVDLLSTEGRRFVTKETRVGQSLSKDINHLR
jgi:hypothetical protein